MTNNEQYFSINKDAWNKKTPVHVESSFYNQEAFLNGKNSLNDIELGLLGNIQDKNILHLQCHFGQDTISLSRLGAIATGVDIAENAINIAKQTANQLNLQTQFICCNIYDLSNYLNQKFDIVFTSYGTIGWLPDLDKWAKIINHFLQPNGQFIMVDFHPVVWMFDNDFQQVTYNYFNTGAILENEVGTYANKKTDIQFQTASWNHSIGEILNSLISNQFSINSFDEYDYSPYNCFNNTIEVETNKFRIKHMGNKLPMLYAIKATKDKT
ncbi:MAG TPA: class I SAM-dependent methyltransferase [Chitinophagaceae bacterium]|nr:class I SAM-dependent methyltransferase [Chitinophagaceae bacterium]HNN30767.1 class I SAM-dependent methyltransferase [Chitinophagaceae bacterium]